VAAVSIDTAVPRAFAHEKLQAWVAVQGNLDRWRCLWAERRCARRFA